MTKIVGFIDMDSYFASIEQQANPLLRGKPIAVGGKPGTRSIVASASREAKALGVKSAMSGKQALEIIPRLIFVDPSPKRYKFATEQIVIILRRYTANFEVLSIDEMALDFSHFGNWENARRAGERLRREIRQTLGEFVSASVGIAPCKVVAKLASKIEKPDALVVVRPRQVQSLLKKTPIEEISGIGKATAKRLKDYFGVEKVTDICNVSRADLITVFKPRLANWLYNLGRGQISDEISPSDSYFQIKSVSRSLTVDKDLSSRKATLTLIMRLSYDIARALRQKALLARTCQLIVRFKNFSHWQQRATCPTPLYLGEDIYQICKKLSQQVALNPGESARFLPIRMIGVRVNNLLAVNQTTAHLFNPQQAKERVARAIWKLEKIYGDDIVKPAFTLNAPCKKAVAQGFLTH